MFRKIHSKRNPERSIFAEIQKEFGHYLSFALALLKSLLNKHARLSFSIMVLIMSLSIVCSYFKLDMPEKTHQSLASSSTLSQNSAETGFDQIVKVGLALKESIELRKQIDQTLSKKVLSAEDSIQLVKMFDRIKIISIPNHQSHESTP